MVSKAISIKDVACNAKVSQGTVSNVLNRPEKVSESTRKRVRASIHALGFVRNESARQLRHGHSRTLGFVVQDTSNPFFSDVAQGAERVARAAGSFLLIANSHGSIEQEQAYLGLFEEQRAQGVLISPVGNVEEKLRRLRERGITIVLIDSPAPSPEYSSVRTDDVAGGRLAVEHLIATGRQRIGFLGGPKNLHQVSNRLTGAHEAFQLAARDPSDLRIWHAESSTVEAGRLFGRTLASLPVDDLPDSIFATNDLLAIGVLHAVLNDRRLRIPEDLSIIGYDDIGRAESAVVPLSTIRQPSELIGATAARLLLDESELVEGFRHEQVLFMPKLVVRASTVAV